MNDIKSAIITITVSMIIYGVVLLFVPKGEMGKTFKTVVALALIFTVVSVIFSFDLNLEFDKTEYKTGIVSDIKTNVNVVDFCEYKLEEYISEEFKFRGIRNFKISVSMDISDENSIFIKSVNVCCNSENYNDCDKILKNLGLVYSLTEIENADFQRSIN